MRTTFDKYFKPAVAEEEIGVRIPPAQSTVGLNTQIRNASTINERLALLSQVTQARSVPHTMHLMYHRNNIYRTNYKFISLNVYVYLIQLRSNSISYIGGGKMSTSSRS